MADMMKAATGASDEARAAALTQSDAVEQLDASTTAAPAGLDCKVACSTSQVTVVHVTLKLSGA